VGQPLSPEAVHQARAHAARAPRGILAAIRLGLTNGRLEGLNSKIRLSSHRGYGFHSAEALIALVYLCCTGITIELPRMSLTPNSTGAALIRPYNA